jgi:hypothetical protein
MFNVLANVHHQIATSEVLLPPNRFWYYLPDPLFEIQNVTVSFQMELEHLISHEVPWSAISLVQQSDPLALAGRPRTAAPRLDRTGDGPDDDRCPMLEGGPPPPPWFSNRWRHGHGGGCCDPREEGDVAWRPVPGRPRRGKIEVSWSAGV